MNLSKNTDKAVQTLTHVDAGFSETVLQNSMRLGTTIMSKVLLMHVVRFLKSDHSAPSGGRLNFSKNTDIGSSDFDACGHRFLRNCTAEFNETMYNNYIEGVVTAPCLIFKIRSFGALWWKIEL